MILALGRVAPHTYEILDAGRVMPTKQMNGDSQIERLLSLAIKSQV
jgi:hypothetical protein